MKPRRPPKRSCRECGSDVYSWTEAPTCPACSREIRGRESFFPKSETQPRESFREFRARLRGRV